MITQEEKDEIVALAVEKTLLAIPEVVGNLIANHAALHKINKDFYDKHKEFATRKDIVQAVVEMVEGQNPLDNYPEILEKAVPEIRRRMEIVKTVNVTDAPEVMPRDFSNVPDDKNNGRI
jgi:hypothetical protein